ncbi:hypothetical protein HDU80_002332 [Chytriomyces hyalinus]|nr:hypothetical protein HDU80_002332 [Chytriomyces hyalinus]
MANYLIFRDGELFRSTHSFVYANLGLLTAAYSTKENDAFVDVSIDMLTLNSDAPVLSPMANYWRRPHDLIGLNYIDLMENYTMLKGESQEKTCWKLNKNLVRKVMIFNSRQLPNLKKDVAKDVKEIYYTALLCLFKPHMSDSDLKCNPEFIYLKDCFRYQANVILVKSHTSNFKLNQKNWNMNNSINNYHKV